VIDPPLWLVILPIVASPLVYLTRRWFVGVVLAALVAVFTGWLAWSLPATNPIRLMGRPFLLDSLAQHVLALIFIMAAVLFLASWQLPHMRSFFPFGLILLGLLAAALMARHLGIAALLATVCVIAAVPVIQDGQAGSTRAAWRFLIMWLLTLPFFLLASWRIDLYREDVENAIYLGQAALFLAMGMSVWLAVVPLHGWLTATGSEAPPVAAALVLTGFPLLALVALLQIFSEATWFTWLQQAGQLLLMAGLISTAAGGLLAAVQRGLRPLLGYTALFDLGCLLVALALGGQEARLAFYAGLAIRALGLGLTGVATARVCQAAGGDGFAALRGAGYRVPVATLALLVGVFTLAGLPLTAGFLPRWFLLHDLARTDSRWLWLLIGSGVGVTVGYLRSLNVMLAAPVNPARAAGISQAWLTTLVLIVLMLVSLALGIFPAPLLNLAQRLLSAYPIPPL
jgi:NADH:ubiquinone oxidoreductase subunit 2 (subunit N)